MGKTNERIVATASIHRFGFSLYEHVHLYICEVNSVFEDVLGDRCISRKRAPKPTACAVLLSTTFSPPTSANVSRTSNGTSKVGYLACISAKPSSAMGTLPNAMNGF
jgi:hypothetical protein